MTITPEMRAEAQSRATEAVANLDARALLQALWTRRHDTSLPMLPKLPSVLLTGCAFSGFP